MTEAQALAIRFKADWEIWSNPMPRCCSGIASISESEFRQMLLSPGRLALLAEHPCLLS
jgi:hypothetical protein